MHKDRDILFSRYIHIISKVLYSYETPLIIRPPYGAPSLYSTALWITLQPRTNIEKTLCRIKATTLLHNSTEPFLQIYILVWIEFFFETGVVSVRLWLAICHVKGKKSAFSCFRFFFQRTNVYITPQRTNVYTTLTKSLTNHHNVRWSTFRSYPGLTYVRRSGLLSLVCVGLKS